MTHGIVRKISNRILIPKKILEKILFFDWKSTSGYDFSKILNRKFRTKFRWPLNVFKMTAVTVLIVYCHTELCEIETLWSVTVNSVLYSYKIYMDIKVSAQSLKLNQSSFLRGRPRFRIGTPSIPWSLPITHVVLVFVPVSNWGVEPRDSELSSDPIARSFSSSILRHFVLLSACIWWRSWWCCHSRIGTTTWHREHFIPLVVWFAILLIKILF